MTAVLTHLFVGIDGEDPGTVIRRVRTAVRDARVRPEREQGISHHLAGVAHCAFSLASDAVAAALELVPPRRDGREGAARALLATTVQGAGLDGVRAEHVAACLGMGDPGEILLTASAAVLVGPALPAELEVVEHRTDVAGSERLYRLRREPAGGGKRRATGGPVRSSLAWAHRAARRRRDGSADLHRAAAEAAWQRTLRGDRRVVLVTGEDRPEFVAEQALRLHAAGAQVLYGRWDADQISSFSAFREVLGTVVAGLGDPALRRLLDGYRTEVGWLLPDVAARLGAGGVPPAADDEVRVGRLAEAFVAWLDQLADDRPVLVVLDDVQAAEPASLRLVEYLTQVASAASWMLLLGVSPSDAEPSGEAWPVAEEAEWADGPHVVRLDVPSPSGTLR